MKRLILSIVVVACSYVAASAQKVTVSGHIEDAATGETLLGGVVMLKDSGIGSSSNEFGFYSLTFSAGHRELEYSFLGYESKVVSLDFQRDTVINVRLVPSASIEQANVYASRDVGVASAYLGSLEISKQLLETYPAVLGEPDVIKLIQTMPGVQGGMSGFSGIHVRGGGADENLVMLDGTALYNLNHMLGLFSVFTPDMVKKVTLYKGSFPARYGGRVSSVIDVRTIDGNESSLHGSVSAGLLSDKLFLEGPIGSHGTTFSFGVRGMHTFLLDRAIKWIGSPANYAFYDINGKISHRFSDRDRVYLGVYYGNDYFRFEESSERVETEPVPTTFTDKVNLNLSWGNAAATLRWNHVFSNRLFSNLSVYGNRYAMNLKLAEEGTEAFEGSSYCSNTDYSYFSGIDDVGTKLDFEYTPMPEHLIHFGAEGIRHVFRPETSRMSMKATENDVTAADTTVNNAASRRVEGFEGAVYVEDEISLGSKVRVVPGFRLSFFNVRGRTYMSPEPRLSVAYDFVPGWNSRAAYSRMSQYVHQLTSGSFSLPTDLWVPITENIAPVYSDIFSVGLSCAALQGWEFSLEAYWKELYNVLEYKDGREALSGTGNWEDNVEVGRGRSKGIEAYVSKTSGRATGSFAYTLSKTDRWFPDGTINGGRVFPFKYDRRHVLNVNFSYKLNEKLDFGAAWSYMSGYNITVPTRKTEIEGPDGSQMVIDYVPSRNAYTTPSAHHLDLRLNLHKRHRRGEGIWNFTVYNIYNAMNPDWVMYEDRRGDMDDSGERYIPSISVRTFLTILPSFSYTYKF